MKNNIFLHENGRFSWANACVGNNGNPGIWTYAEGFIKSAELIINSTIRESELQVSIDELVYPACFNLRHAIELAIKAATQALSYIASIKGATIQDDIEKSHDISYIWANFKAESLSLDSRFASIISLMDDIIHSFSETDPTGQTFRYPTSSYSHKHLTEIAIINFFKLKEITEATKKSIKELKTLSKRLTEEYNLGTFTKSLSRDDIQAISKKLPPINSWKNPEFGSTKEKLKADFKISGRELSKAINIIKRHHQFSQNIGVTIPLNESHNHHVGRFIYWAVTYYSATKTSQPGNGRFLHNFQKFIEETQKSAKLEKLAWKDFSHLATPKNQAVITSLYYFGSELDFSENYVNDLHAYCKEFEIHGMRSIENSFQHILRKTDAIPSIINSLSFLGHKKLSTRLTKTYNLKKHFGSIK